MGCELLTNPTQTKTYTEIFQDNFPFYLAIGMSSAEYWSGDSSLVRYYRKAYRIKQDEVNQSAWVQGLYVYDAFSTALYNFSRGFSKNPSAAKTYTQQPYNFENKEKSEAEKAIEVQIEQEKAAAWMENFVRINKKRAESR